MTGGDEAPLVVEQPAANAAAKRMAKRLTVCPGE
jgi:hypothetical protein